MKISLIFIRDKRFFSRPSEKFLRRRRKHPYPGGKKHYVLGEPPLGIMYLSSTLKRAGHEVSLTDQCHPEYTDERYLDSIKEKRPDIVGISFLSNMCYPAARSLARKVKSALPSAKLVFGGVFATINARKIVENEDSVDVVARGEGENIILELAGGSKKLDDIPGLSFRSKSGAVVETPDSERITSLDDLPFPDRDSLDINYVASLPLDVPAVIWDRPYTTVLSSRGCPFDCIYCNCPTFSNRRCVMRSAGNILKELDEIEKQGHGAFTFVDDNFLLKPRRAEEICDGMKDRGHSFSWACQGRPESKVHGVFEPLSSAGCDLLMFGIESGSQRVLDSLRKKTKVLDVEKAVVRARQAGIGIRHGFFIVGAPGETAADVEETFKLAERIPINSFGFNSLTAFRGTPLWRDAVAKGLIDEEKDWDQMFPVHAIYADALDSQTLFKLRSGLVRRLIKRKIMWHPLEALRIIMRFLKCMSARDIYSLLTSSMSDHARPRV
ncbi:MAG: radical SAM protein [Elusimicrobiota bacterium]